MLAYSCPFLASLRLLSTRASVYVRFDFANVRPSPPTVIGSGTYGVSRCGWMIGYAAGRVGMHRRRGDITWYKKITGTDGCGLGGYEPLIRILMFWSVGLWSKHALREI